MTVNDIVMLFVLTPAHVKTPFCLSCKLYFLLCELSNVRSFPVPLNGIIGGAGKEKRTDFKQTNATKICTHFRLDNVVLNLV